MAWIATIANVMFPCCQHYVHAAQADNRGGSLPFLSKEQNRLSPPNYEALVGKL